MAVLRLRTLWLPLILVCCLATVASAQPVGSIDLRFGNSGYLRQTVDPDAPEGSPLQLAALPQGGFYTCHAAVLDGDPGMIIRRYDAQSQQDLQYGDEGERWVALRGEVHSMMVLPDSSLLLGGFVLRGRDQEPWIMKLLRDGRAAPSFGTQGVLTLDRQGQGSVIRLLAGPDHGLLAGVQVTGEGVNHDIYVYQLHADGDIDLRFGQRGAINPAISRADKLIDIARREDGRLLLFTNTREAEFYDFSLQRYLPNGQPDPAFGRGGRVVFRTGLQHCAGRAMQLLPDGSAYLAGQTKRSIDDPGMDLIVVKFLPEGQLDLTFAEEGLLAIDLQSTEQMQDILAFSDGQILVGATHGTEASIMRFDAYGKRDATYGNAGAMSFELPDKTRIQHFQLSKTHSDQVHACLQSKGAAAITRLHGNPDLPGLDRILAFSWDPEDQQTALPYATLRFHEDLHVDAWVGGPRLEAMSGTESMEPIEQHITFYAHLAMSPTHRYTFVWDSEGHIHWYLNTHFQGSASVFRLR